MMIVSAFADEASSELSGQIRALLRNGLTRIDVRAIDGKNISEMSFAACEAYRARFDEHGITVNCLASPIGKVDLDIPFDESLARFDAILTKAKIFGTDKVRIFSFYHAKGRFGEVVSRLRTMTERAAKEGITLYHENELGICGERASDVAALVKNVPGLKVLYDPANFVLVGQEIEEAETLLLDGCEFFHIKDATYDGKIVPAGEGDGDLAGALGKAAVKFATVEPHLIEFDGYGNIDARAIRSIRTFKDGNEAFDYGVSAFLKLLEKGERT